MLFVKSIFTKTAELHFKNDNRISANFASQISAKYFRVASSAIFKTVTNCRSYSWFTATSFYSFAYSIFKTIPSLNLEYPQYIIFDGIQRFAYSTVKFRTRAVTN